MFVNPMMLPFIMYQRWLEIVFLPFLESTAGASKAAMDEAKGVQSEVVSTTKRAVKYRG